MKRIAKSTTTHGREFEAEVAKFLKAAGFEIEMNAKAAKPRQTDLYATGGEVDLLVEVKNQKRDLDVSDIDNLRARLNRISPDVVGVIFTASGLGKGAIEAITADRTREIIVFVRDEIESLRKVSQNLKTLIKRKRNELRVQGKAWFGPATNLEFLKVKLPLGNVEFRINGKKKSYFESKSDFAGALYSLHIPDTGWASTCGEGARISLQLALKTTNDLRNLVGYLHKKFNLSNNGMFSIQQSNCSWHGVGLENSLQAIEQWRQRYKKSPSETFHHSEGFIYFDQFRDGWLEISTQQRIDWDLHDASFFHHSELTIQLPGIPIDISPFIKLCEYTGNDRANFHYIGQRWTVRRRLKKPIVLDVVGTILSNEHPPITPRLNQAIIGIVAQNPFFQKILPEELVDKQNPFFDGLGETELLPCSLRHWYDDGDTVDDHTLQGFEATIGGAGILIRPFGSWSGISK